MYGVMCVSKYMYMYVLPRFCVPVCEFVVWYPR